MSIATEKIFVCNYFKVDGTIYQSMELNWESQRSSASYICADADRIQDKVGDYEFIYGRLR